MGDWGGTGEAHLCPEGGGGGSGGWVGEGAEVARVSVTSRQGHEVKIRALSMRRITIECKQRGKYTGFPPP